MKSRVTFSDLDNLPDFEKSQIDIQAMKRIIYQIKR